MSITLENLLDAGAHFGHQTHRWNPKMKPYIFGARNGIYIINLEKTLAQWNETRHAIENVVAKGGKLLFVGTKPQAAEIIEEEAKRAGQFFVNRRWLGGMLTNYPTIALRIQRMKEIETILASDTAKDLAKKDISRMEKERIKLDRSLSGIRDMVHLPKMIVVVDPNKEHLACAEARKLGIPIVALVDTNCDPDGIDYVIPANDDALKSIRLFFTEIANVCLDGSKSYETFLQKQAVQKTKEEPKKQAVQAVEEKTDGPVVEKKKDLKEVADTEAVNAS